MALATGVAFLSVSCSPEASKAPTVPAPPSAVSAEEVQAALSRGRAVAGQAFSLLSSNLVQAIERQGVSNALPFCSAQALPLTSLVAQTNDVILRRISHKARNPANRADDAELLHLTRLQADLDSRIPLQPTVVATGPNTVTVYVPIVITNTLCLKCHGQPEEDIALEDLVTIRRLYPADAATGFKLGDLRGLWRIDLRRSALAEQK